MTKKIMLALLLCSSVWLSTVEAGCIATASPPTLSEGQATTNDYCDLYNNRYITPGTLGANRVYGNLVTDCSVIGIKINISGTAASYVNNNTVARCDTSFYTQTSQSNWNVNNNLSFLPLTYHASWGSTSTSKPDYNSYYPSTGNVFAENTVATDFA